MSVFKRLSNLARGKVKQLRREWNQRDADPEDPLDEPTPVRFERPPAADPDPPESAPEPPPPSDEPPKPKKKRL